MRISTNQLYDQNIRAIMDNQRGLADTQLALASGKKLNKPSDDPVGASKVIRLTEELDKLTQYQRNNDLLSGSLEQQEAILSNINDSVNRARVLMIQAGSGLNADADRKAIGTEIEQIRNEVLDLMNSQDADGNYIFAGFQSQTQAFSFNPAAPGNAVVFEGDSGTREVKISDSVGVRATTSGQDVFENVLARFNFTVTGSTGASVSEAIVGQQSDFDQFYERNYDSSTPANNNYRLTVLAGNQVELRNTGTGAVVDTVAFQSGQPVTIAGLKVTMDATTGNTVDLTLDAPEKKSLAQTLHEAFVALTSDSLNELEYRESLNDALIGIDNGLEKLALETSSLGGRMNVAESVYETNLDLEIAAKSARSSIEDVDYAEASAEFAKQETALNAALATFPKVTGLSLFDYI